MRNLTVLILAGMLLAVQTACATHAALTMPGPANDEAMQIGMHRGEVESVLGFGSSSEYENGGTLTVRYEYSDGPPQVSKLRSLVYLGGDFFTAFLSELVFWPIELYATERIQRVAIAAYNSENELVEWTIQRQNGEILHEVASGPPTEAGEIALEPKLRP